MNRDSKLGVATLAVFSLGFAITPTASADTLLFDRGLPTANLNDGAGADRSNVAWGDNGPTSIGDNFTLGSGPNSYNISQITVWVVDTSGTTPAANAYTLWLGADTKPGAASNASVAAVTTSTVVTPVTYANGQTYQGQSGAFYPIYKVDFTGLNLAEAPGTYAFGVSGFSDSGLTTPYLSASNGPLSGSTQTGDDGIVYAFGASGNMDVADGYPWASIGGWDKSSDINVQVDGTAIPEPASLTILGLGLAGLGAVLRRKQA